MKGAIMLRDIIPKEILNAVLPYTHDSIRIVVQTNQNKLQTQTVSKLQESP
jgi:hypothetical protein